MTTELITNKMYQALVSLALKKSNRGWVPLGPLNRARQGHKLAVYRRANVLADLERLGLIRVAEKQNKPTASLYLTDAGKAAILAMPDDIHEELYPWPCDIAAAKAKLGGQEPC